MYRPSRFIGRSADYAKGQKQRESGMSRQKHTRKAHTTTVIDRPGLAAAYRGAVVRIAAVLLVALFALPLTACRDTDSGLDPPPGRGMYHPHDPGGFYPDDRSVYPDLGSGTNHCAFPGDQLCPDTPVRVPPPNIQGW
jgi:hypothetical protein